MEPAKEIERVLGRRLSSNWSRHRTVGRAEDEETHLVLGEVLVGRKRSMGNGSHGCEAEAVGAVVGLALGEAAEGLHERKTREKRSERA